MDSGNATLESRLSRDAQRETELLHSRLRDIAQAVINDDQFNSSDIGLLNTSGGSLSPRSRSPVKRQVNTSRPVSRTGSPFADATFSALQAALYKRQLQVSKKKKKLLLSIVNLSYLQIHDLKTKLDNNRDINSNLKKTNDELENEKRRLEQQLNETRLQLEEIKRNADDYSREIDHSKHQLETTNYEKSNLEKVRMVWLRKFKFY